MLRHFFTHRFTKPLQHFHTRSLVLCLSESDLGRQILSPSSTFPRPPEPLMPLRNTWPYHSFSSISLEEHCTSVTCIFCKSHNAMLTRCSENRSHTSATRLRNTHVLLAPQVPHNRRQYVEIVTGARWNMHTRLHYNQISRLPLSLVIKSFGELHNHTK
jgi:hypothetical protein